MNEFASYIITLDKGHGRIEERTVTLVHETDWLTGERRFPGETRLPDVASLIRVQGRTELKDRCRFETRYYVSSAPLTAEKAGEAVRGHWRIENSLHWVLDLVFSDDQSRLRKGHGAHNMAVVRHFALNLVRAAPPIPNQPRSPLKRGPKPGSTPKPPSLRLRRKMAGWNSTFMQAVLGAKTR
ncbi:MAG: ISAs1 family transposase [Rhodospirillales bacterium]|nr:ISAs1 family transposase [Acetobacter sp.]